MAIDGAAEQGPIATEHSHADDYQAHFRDYSGFIRLFKYLAIFAFVMALFVMFIIS
jgi:hypothetical protein